MSLRLGPTPSPWAPLTFVVWVGVSLWWRDGVPFLKFPAFQFPSADGVTAVLLFRADGADATVTDFEGFSGIGPGDIDTAHHGVPCSVEHRLYEAQRWIADHPQTEERPDKIVVIEVGLRMVSVDEEGRLRQVDRVDAVGAARPR